MSEREGDLDSLPERVLIVVSTAFTIALFVFVVWQGVATPTFAAPTAAVGNVTPLPNGDLRVAVILENQQNVGLSSVTVAVECDTPPPELTFENVPADDRRLGYVVCPAGTKNATATVSSWIEV
ncbi:MULTISPECIES: hypothetical protein [unclassified Haladaptatus]|uniref:hypothetical protein n=1 Tax=unclassified Haladaptatus TaxID=2622732 RepID=UPI0023E7E20B|nr:MULTISPECIES: hypothetical protein [unclassified Haladaptatus]